ncbi:hypothetical protein K523DRAFT_364026 [Schizophyllum commune Tattone D]|nr:hypothetical protein K523DRAFT_364026 [Schizophyllum commune Tattone D]
MSSEREYLYTFDENDDPTLLVITPPMCRQSPEGHLDAYGRPYAQYPSFFGLCYAVSTNHIVDMCKRTGDGYYGDRSFTIIKFFERLEAATGVNRDNGIHRVELPSGLIAYLLVISCSDQLETLPHPKNRIQKFKQVLHTNRDPSPRKLGQPRRHAARLSTATVESTTRFISLMKIQRASTWTCDADDEDVRRMVITPGMIGQKASVCRDRLGRCYSQLPNYYGLCYAITTSNIYNMCKARPIDSNGNQWFFGDRCFTILKWYERLEAATGISRGKGLYECRLQNGQPMMMLIVACSDNEEDLPRPARRIQRFKDFLGTSKEPMVKVFRQPRATFTLDENEDPRLMVITPPLCRQTPKVHRDSYGVPYTQMPSFFGLCYATTTSNIYNMCRRTGDGFYRDRCFTLIKFFDRLEEALGLSLDNGIHRVELPSGFSCSDKAETLPRPAARIRKFKELLHTEREPVPRQLIQPRNFSALTSQSSDVCVTDKTEGVRHSDPDRRAHHIRHSTEILSMSIERASTWTCDESDEDVRRMVITPRMISQKANIHRDSLGRPYSQLPDYHGLCYAITPSNIYNMCKARPIDRQGHKCFYGDRCFTIYKWFERLEEATGISRGKGLYECALDDGQPMMILVVACSDEPDTVPRPAARIKAFKDFLGTKREPMFKRFVQPRMYSA